jgi:ribosomal protein S6--L-glutamate ligase
MTGPVVGVPVNPLARNVPTALLDAARAAGIATRRVDLATLTARVGDGLAVEDDDGPVHVTHLAPPLLYWQDAAAVALEAGEALGWRALNSVAATLLADDKAATAVALSRAQVAQLPTVVVPQDPVRCREAADHLGWPVVVKRAHGAQGRWVRRADDPTALGDVLNELGAEGAGALVLQELCAEAAGTSLRVICTGGRVLASTERTGPPGDLRSNIAGGGRQRAVHLTGQEAGLALAATTALRLGHAGVDLLRTHRGPVVLEVNACPDFTSMRQHVDVDLASAVLDALLD